LPQFQRKYGEIAFVRRHKTRAFQHKIADECVVASATPPPPTAVA
jgi:hypothetical protein